VEGGRPVAERIRESVERHISAIDPALRITVSIGIASCPKIATNSRDLISAADKALYHAKNEGKNRVVVSLEE
jgi:diguanylate cyclase (GGDEF)-like protein